MEAAQPTSSDQVSDCRLVMAEDQAPVATNEQLENVRVQAALGGCACVMCLERGSEPLQLIDSLSHWCRCQTL